MTANIPFPAHPFGQQIDQHNIEQRLAQANGWEAKNRLLVQLARELPDWPAELRTQERLVSGCESRVWLHIREDRGHFQISADSDSRIVKGLLTLVLTAYHDKTTGEIASFDLERWIEKLGLLRFLSASRGNGLRAITREIVQQTQYPHQ
ncbi:SufE family protein [Chitinilyticum piscinae]|uniref:SufE family protein n=1 Tax=Chitinilyticum piscinae TaxID=2866724 RepID=A0A8J7FHS4_9NEIS|nr:SufE family protein [Chitinilyticum piscinae]MBE9609693.1 SufE family protein [Chitinilyticum piscinae]